MEINREKLLQNLQNSIVGAEKGDFLNNAFSFKDGYVHTFKDFLALSIYLGEEFKFLKGSIRAAEFYSLLTKYSTETINLEVTEKGLEVSSGRSKATFTFIEESVLKQVDNMDFEHLVWKPVPDDFRDALSYCLIGVREYAYEGVRVKGKLAISADTKRVNYFELKEDCGDFLLEEKVIGELLKFQDYVQLSQSDQRVFIKLTDGTIISGRRKMDNEYPRDKIIQAIESLAPVETDVGGKLPATFRQMINRATVLSTDLEGSRVVTLTFAPDFIKCESERPIGRYEEKVDWEEPPKGMDKPITLNLESISALYALEKSRRFVIKESEAFQRLVFLGDNCKCFLVAYAKES